VDRRALVPSERCPLDAATQTFAFIARKGAGKTYAAGKLVELLLDAGVQVVVLDTVGNWYGLRLAADGKGKGLRHPGPRRAARRHPARGRRRRADRRHRRRHRPIDGPRREPVLEGDRKRFAAAFGERLWLRKKGERHPAPLHLVIEESQLIVPQDVRGDTATMVGVYEEIIRLGRNYGIGVSMITQRPQSVNKEVLNQTECLFVGQVNGAQERDALKKWITHQGMDVHLVDELPSLKIGTFYVWSPQWLQIL
jgi:DNA helicase HerA-like ATPase